MANKHLIQTRVPKEIYTAVKQLASASGASLATWVRQLLIREAKKS